MARPELYPVKKVIGFEQEMLDAVDEWRAKQKPIPNVSDAIRLLVELGLTVEPSTKPTNKATRSARARDLATTAVDKMSDPGAGPELRDERRKTLIKGPAEFREARVDTPRRKK